MKRLVFAVASEPAAAGNVERSLTHGIRADALSTASFADLPAQASAQVAAKGDLRLWGVRAGKGNQDKKQWARIKPDDWLVVARRTDAWAARIYATADSPAIAHDVWQDNAFACVMFVGDVMPLALDLATLRAAIGYSLVGFVVPTDTGQSKIGDVDDFVSRFRTTSEDTARVNDWLGACQCAWIECETATAALRLETEMRLEFKPPLNRL